MDTLVKISLVIAVAVVFPVMVGLGIEAFYPPPEISTAECEAIAPRFYPDAPKEETEQLSEAEVAAKIKQSEECYKRIREPENRHNAVVFALASIIGFAAIVVGALKFPQLAGPAGPGLVLGGLFSIMYASARGFESVDKRWLFGVAFLTMLGIIWVSRQWFVLSGEDQVQKPIKKNK